MRCGNLRVIARTGTMRIEGLDYGMITLEGDQSFGLASRPLYVMSNLLLFFQLEQHQNRFIQCTPWIYDLCKVVRCDAIIVLCRVMRTMVVYLMVFGIMR